MSGTIVDDHRVLPGDRTAADRTLLRRPATPRNRIPAFRSWHGRQRDWALVALVALLGAGRLVLLNYLDPLLTPLWSELVLGLLSTSLLLWRRRMPTAVAVAQVPLTLFSGFAGCAGAVGLFTVAARRRLPIAFAVGLLSGLACYVNLIYTAPYLVRWQSVSAIVAASVAVISWGRLVRARSELVDSLTERAVRAECEQALRIEQAKRAERARITSEMHDVLAQRMSMLSMQASALEVTALSSPERIAHAAGTIRGTARLALRDLRTAIGVLDEARLRGLPERPQPTLPDLPLLLDEVRRAGTEVRLVDGLGDLEDAPADIGRHAYRIVQEGLANARLHAAGIPINIALRGGPEIGLHIEVRNRLPTGTSGIAVVPSAGTGLIALGERAQLCGGRLTHGSNAAAEFVLAAWLPWPA